jgi:hypothetical protein
MTHFVYIYNTLFYVLRTACCQHADQISSALPEQETTFWRPVLKRAFKANRYTAANTLYHKRL